MLRYLLSFALLVASGLVKADDGLSVFSSAVETKLSRIASYNPMPQVLTNNAGVEQSVLVDVNADGSVAKVQDQAPVIDGTVSAQTHRLIFMASPFPKLPPSLSREFSAVRLLITFVVVPQVGLSVKHLSVKGGYKYVEF